MPAATAIVELITQDILTWLNTVTVANNYANNFTVERRKKGGNAPRAGQTLVVINQGQPQEIVDDSHPDQSWDQPYGIDVFVDPDQSSATAVDALINSAWADTIKALTSEVTSFNRGGLALWTKIKAPIIFIQNGNPGIQVRLMVRYATIFSDPTVSAYS